VSPIALPAEQPTLLTPRLRLRRFTEADAPQVQHLAGDDAVAATTLVIPHPYPDGVAETWIAGHAQEWAQSRRATWAITRSTDASLVGAIDLFFRLARHQAGSGYWIGRDYWGQGYATEALRAAIAWGFDELGLHRIEAMHLTRNPASGRVMEKAGMLFEGTLRGSAMFRGRLEDLSLRAVLASDPRPDTNAAPTATR
jgi:ribosomal-protein-alanine N-acetyltransferase